MQAQISAVASVSLHVAKPSITLPTEYVYSIRTSARHSCRPLITSQTHRESYSPGWPHHSKVLQRGSNLHESGMQALPHQAAAAAAPAAAVKSSTLLSCSADHRAAWRNRCCLARSALLRPAIADISIAEAAEHDIARVGVFISSS